MTSPDHRFGFRTRRVAIRPRDAMLVARALGRGGADRGRSHRRGRNGLGEEQQDHKAGVTSSIAWISSAISESRDRRWSPSLIRCTCTSAERTSSASRTVRL